jgi:perosamine synthetase
MISGQVVQKLKFQIIEAIEATIGNVKAPLHEPNFDAREREYLIDCLDSNCVSSVGNYISGFETKLGEFTGAKYVVAMSSGTAALHTAMKILGVSTGKEILLSPLTFIATANAISYCGGIPHFVDIEKDTLGIDPEKLQSYLDANTTMKQGQCHNKITKRPITHIVIMHTFGHPSKVNELRQIAEKYELVLLEDAAESLGSWYQDQHTGTFGEIGILSFNGNKIITTGNGGALLTNNEFHARLARHLSTTAKLPHPWEYTHDMIGYNYRLPNINAALGCAQIEKIGSKIDSKRELFLRYRTSFESINGVSLMKEPINCVSNYWLQTLILDSEFSETRDNIIEGCHNAGFYVRPAWNLLNHLKPYADCPTMDLSTAENLSRRIINLPSSPTLVRSVKSGI